MNCSRCGAELKEDGSCDRCGHRQSPSIEVEYKDFKGTEMLDIRQRLSRSSGQRAPAGRAASPSQEPLRRSRPRPRPATSWSFVTIMTLAALAAGSLVLLYVLLRRFGLF